MNFTKLPEAVEHARMVLIVLKISNENQAKVTTGFSMILTVFESHRKLLKLKDHLFTNTTESNWYIL